MTDSKTCPAVACGQTFTRRPGQSPSHWKAKRFCSRACGYAGQGRPGRPRGQRCGKDLHDMTGDNVRVYDDGRRRCRACATARDAARPDRQPGKRSPTGTTAAPRQSRPVRRLRSVSPPSVQVPPAPPSPARPPWRPSGWSPTPQIREVSA